MLANKTYRVTAAILSGFTSDVIAAATPQTQSTFAAMQVLVGLLIVVIAIFVLAWLVKRLAPGNLTGNKQMRVISYLMLGNREKAVLVQIGEKQMLLGVAPGRVTTLCEFDQPVVPVATERNETLPFAKQWMQTIKKSGGAYDNDQDNNNDEAGNKTKDKSALSDFSRYMKDILSHGQQK